MMMMKMKEKTMQCQGHQREQDPGKQNKTKQKQTKKTQSHMQDHQKPEASYNCQAQLKFASVELDLS